MEFLSRMYNRLIRPLRQESGQGALTVLYILLGVSVILGGVIVISRVTAQEAAQPALSSQVEHWDARTNPGEVDWDGSDLDLAGNPASSEGEFWDKTKKFFGNGLDWAADQVENAGEELANWVNRNRGLLKGIVAGAAVAFISTLLVIAIVGTGGAAILPIVWAAAALAAGGIYGHTTDINPEKEYSWLIAMGWSAVAYVSAFLSTGGASALVNGISHKLATQGVGKFIINNFSKAVIKSVGESIIKGLSRAGATSLYMILARPENQNRMPTLEEMAVYVGAAVIAGAVLDAASKLSYYFLSQYQGGGQWAWKLFGKVKGAGEVSAWLRNHQTFTNVIQNDLVKKLIKAGAELDIVPGFIGSTVPVLWSLFGNLEGAGMFIMDSYEQIIDIAADLIGG